jgi:hypothetical protein
MAVSILLIAHLSGWAQGPTWIHLVFLSIIVLGFCIWEGRFFGIQIKNNRFSHFKFDLKARKHLFADIKVEKEAILGDVIRAYPC